MKNYRYKYLIIHLYNTLDLYNSLAISRSVVYKAKNKADLMHFFTLLKKIMKEFQSYIKVSKLISYIIKIYHDLRVNLLTEHN